ncbi:hypothetical protein M427DRAFT_264694 [Gonapodya prolifera JEL478]|uniref:CBS-domain-containing protein n=1 Tax=Gonapodya prolifera (strain JEL478) TaxID=1344416 RepID=A0A139AKX8_GONPJ|nr:hypothetical protein M427DRAFT_264694 [Gonapodya prolifera JEL478]|eukprot:KXS17174.1 hypothetical protein M427DRAFT_264694 [Gonapodya prolifera JEL478]
MSFFSVTNDMAPANLSKHRRFIFSQKVVDLVQDQDTGVKGATLVPSTGSIEGTLKTLEESDSRNAIVYDSDGGKVLGVVSTVDVMVYFGGIRPQLEAAAASSIPSVAYTALLNRPVTTLIGLSRESRSLSVLYETDPLDSLLEVLCNLSHSVIVREDVKRGTDLTKEENLKIVEQLDVVKFLLAHVESLGDIMDNTAASLSFAVSRVSPPSSPSSGYHHVIANGLESDAKRAPPSVTTVHAEEQTLLALERMCQHKHTSLPVLQSSGEIHSVFSSTILRHIKASNMEFLLQPVIGYLQHILKGVPPAQTAFETFTLTTCMANITRHSFHRIFLVTRGMNVTGVIAATDILAVLRQDATDLEPANTPSAE